MAFFILLASGLLLMSLPYWLPSQVVKLRITLFTRINGKEALQLPIINSDHDQFDSKKTAAQFHYIYSHPAMNGRSRGAALSDLFWYWLAPGPQMHQEHIENGPEYEKIASLSRKILAISRSNIETLVNKHISPCLTVDKPWQFVRIRDWIMPFWADFYYELVFQQKPTPFTQQLIVDNARDVVMSLKCCGLRHMRKRYRLTRFIIEKLNKGEFPQVFPAGFSITQQAYYLQGTFFNTAIVQMSEAVSHLLMTLAEHSHWQEKLAQSPDNRQLYDQVIDECLRLYPLFGIAHRISSDDIMLNEHVIKKNSVVCFNYSAYQCLGFENAKSFQPQRWRTCPIKEANFIPFGVMSNRPCPAQGIAMVSMKKLTQELLKKYEFFTSAAHTRSLPNRAPCIIKQRATNPLTQRFKKNLLFIMKLRDRWEDLFISLIQLILGTIMVIDARRLRLCKKHFINTKKTKTATN